jgi:uncharacterized protein with NRDE domain
MLTNVRDPARRRSDAPSRGALVTQWLDEAKLPHAGHRHNPFNLIGGDLLRNAWWWSDDTRSQPQPLPPGVHGLSNASLDTPWPKVQRVKDALGRALDAADDAPALTTRLLALLDERAVAPDAVLPDTGVGLERERWLSPLFIASPDGDYGTRCSTVLIGERRGDDRWHLSITERTFDVRGRARLDRSVELDGWPETHARSPVQQTPLA